MNSSPNSQDTRALIIQQAEALFQRYGMGKTTVADIARDCAMSPANVYRFFPSKAAIVAAIAQIWLGELSAHGWSIVRQDGSAAERLRRFVLETHSIVRDRYAGDPKVHEMCVKVIGESWEVVEDFLAEQTRVLTAILEDGVRRGEFHIDDVPTTARTVLTTLPKFHHPLLVAECFDEPLTEQAERVVTLLLRGLCAPLTPTVS